MGTAVVLQSRDTRATETYQYLSSCPASKGHSGVNTSYRVESSVGAAAPRPSLERHGNLNHINPSGTRLGQLVRSNSISGPLPLLGCRLGDTRRRR